MFAGSQEAKTTARILNSISRHDTQDECAQYCMMQLCSGVSLLTVIQEASLSLAFQYAETDLYEMVRFHREKERAGLSNAASFHPYTLK